MIRRAVIPVVVVTLGFVLALGYMRTARTPGEPPAVDSLSTATPPTSQIDEQPSTGRADAQPTEVPQPAAASQPQTPTTTASEETIQRLIADTRSPDPQTRFTAIEALAKAPRIAAIPVLEQVLESGEPGTDRQVALQSLHTLALEQGDDDQRIRSVLRGALYHGDDEETSQSAQALLEDIESELARRPPGGK